MIPLLAAVVTVQVNLAFDRTITSHWIKQKARTEAAEIWRDYNVDVRYTDPGVPVAVCVDAQVDHAEHHRPTNEPRPVLGNTTVAESPAARTPVHVSFDAIDDVVLPPSSENAMLHDRAVATALGRVLAHELGHILLGSHHDVEGLMRRSFIAGHFGPDRIDFRLMPASVDRLRDRITSIWQQQSIRGC